MAKLSVHITVEPEGGCGAPISLGRVSDGVMLQLVARRVIDKQRDRAARAGVIDWALGNMANEEANSLEGYFGSVIPGFTARAADVRRDPVTTH